MELAILHRPSLQRISKTLQSVAYNTSDGKTVTLQALHAIQIVRDSLVPVNELPPQNVFAVCVFDYHDSKVVSPVGRVHEYDNRPPFQL